MVLCCLNKGCLFFSWLRMLFCFTPTWCAIFFVLRSDSSLFRPSVLSRHSQIPLWRCRMKILCWERSKEKEMCCTRQLSRLYPIGAFFLLTFFFSFFPMWWARCTWTENERRKEEHLHANARQLWNLDDSTNKQQINKQTVQTDRQTDRQYRQSYCLSQSK